MEITDTSLTAAVISSAAYFESKAHSGIALSDLSLHYHL